MTEVDSSQVATALLTEHLQYTPLSLVDDIIDSVNNFIYQGVGSLETGLLSTPAERLGFKGQKSRSAKDQEKETDQSQVNLAQQEIEEGLHKLETLLSSTVDKNFDLFEIYVLRNILSVPSGLTQHIRLSHYEGLSHPLPGDAPSVETINNLREQLAISRSVSRGLTQEYRRNEAILSQLRSMLDPEARDQAVPNVSFMDKATSEQGFTGPNPLTNNTNFSLSQLPALKTTLESLRSKLQLLQNTEITSDSAKDELREERRQYIEQTTRQHLDRNVHLTTSEANSVPGKATKPGEVEALERAAVLFEEQ